MGEWDRKSPYDRCAAICYLNGTDISEEMVRMGLARDCPRYSGGRYRAAEQQAADDGATIQQGISPARLLRAPVISHCALNLDQLIR